MAVSPILALHIVGGTVGCLSGFVAMAFRKGSRRHAIAGTIFVISMLALAASGAFMATMKFQPGNILGGTMTLYLVATAWLTVKHRHGEKGVADWIALGIALGVALFEVTFGIQAATSPTGKRFGYNFGPYAIFGTVALLAVAGDLRMLVGRGVSGTQRIARHLWRMCFAWFVASASIFLARPHLFPSIMRKSGALVFLTVLPLILLIFWMIRVKFTKAFKKGVPSSRVEEVTLTGKQVSAG
jgi:uncharacterized membrane protein